MNSFLNRIPLILTLAFSLSCSHMPSSAQRTPANSPPVDYPKIFETARETLNTKEIKKLPAESAFIETLQKNPEISPKEALQKALAAEAAAKPVDHTKHLRLLPPAGQPGYSELEYYADHPYISESGTEVPASDLTKVWGNFLASAKEEIKLNVFDFDLEEIADVLIAQAKAKVKVTVGVDADVIEDRPEVQAVVDKLRANKVNVTAVDSVGLNHQKMAAIDWENIDRARVLFSSGNLTQSCLGPEGDLKDVPEDHRPAKSIPNANHVLTMKSWLLANLVQHELTKTLDPKFLYRGSQYPTTGSYQVTGPGVDPGTLEAYPENSLVISFSPGGGFEDINKNIIAHFIRQSTGPIRMIQFAYSSPEVSQALLERAQQSFQKEGKFDFLSIGDTPFALQYWSQFLAMSGLKLDGADDKEKADENKFKFYEENKDSPWIKALNELNPKYMAALRDQVKAAPVVYGNSKVNVDGHTRDVSAKIHHKILATGPFAIVGTSFNFSVGAESNNEQILVFKDKNLVNFVHGMAAWLNKSSPGSVYKIAMDRNARTQKRMGIDDSDDDSAENKSEKRAAQNKKKKKKTQ